MPLAALLLLAQAAPSTLPVFPGPDDPGGVPPPIDCRSPAPDEVQVCAQAKSRYVPRRFQMPQSTGFHVPGGHAVVQAVQRSFPGNEGQAAVVTITWPF